MHHLRNYKSKSPKFDDPMNHQLSPIFDTSTESGRAAGRLEKFSHYVGEIFVRFYLNMKGYYFLK